VSDDQRLGIFCAIDFGLMEAEWNQVGIASKETDGSYSLHFDIWPSNSKHFVLRPLLRREHRDVD